MAASYETIVFADMRDLLAPHKFVIVDLGPEVREIVFARSMQIGEGEGRIPISIRVYTSIDAKLGISRSVGKDAIRVMSFIRMPIRGVPTIVPLHGTGRVNRVPGWQTRLMERINDFLQEKYWARCPKCNLPMREVNGRLGPFLGCVGFPTCNGTRAQLNT